MNNERQIYIRNIPCYHPELPVVAVSAPSPPRTDESFALWSLSVAGLNSPDHEVNTETC